MSLSLHQVYLLLFFPRFLSETYVSIVKNEVIMVKDNYCVLKKERQRILFEIYLYVDFMLNSQFDLTCRKVA